MAENALPPPPDVFGVDGVIVGRAAGLLVHFVGTLLARTALRVLGDQFHVIGVSVPSCRWVTGYMPVAHSFLITGKGETQAR